MKMPSERDEKILEEISNWAESITGDYDDEEYDRSDALKHNCQICLDERWPELSCDYDVAVQWILQAMGFNCASSD